MGIKYHIILYIGLAVGLAMLVWMLIRRNRRTTYRGGKKIADKICSTDQPYIKKKILIYRTGLYAVLTCCILAVIGAFVMMAKPYTSERVQDEKYSRDIILCIDISTSVDYLNENLLTKLKGVVEELQGERFGIVIFNTSPVLLTPLTDDYEFVEEQLDLIAKCLKQRNSDPQDYLYSDDLEWLYYDAYISSGTLVGNEDRGSSLIGDGLAAAAYDFSETSDQEQKRTKVIIFSTDNDIQGTPVATLDEAADICSNNDITVYGIGTKEMTDENKASMKAAVEKTGGQFFVESESGSFGKIVSSIESMSKSLVKTRIVVKESAKLRGPMIIMLIAALIAAGVGKVLKL